MLVLYVHTTQANLYNSLNLNENGCFEEIHSIIQFREVRFGSIQSRWPEYEQKHSDGLLGALRNGGKCSIRFILYGFLSCYGYQFLFSFISDILYLPKTIKYLQKGILHEHRHVNDMVIISMSNIFAEYSRGN